MAGGTHWTPFEAATARKLIAAGHDSDYIAVIIGRTTQAVDMWRLRNPSDDAFKESNHQRASFERQDRRFQLAMERAGYAACAWVEGGEEI